MKIEEKDRPKVIVMGVLAVGLLGYGGYSLLAPPVIVPAEAAKPKPSPSPKAGDKSGDGANGEMNIQDYIKEYKVTGVRYDPFRPNGLLAATPQPSPSPQASPTPQVQATPIPDPTIHLPSPNPGQGGSGQPGATPLPATPAPPPDAPAFTVKGVMIGEESVAILRQGDDLKFVQEGYPVGNGYVVGEIKKNSVELVYERNPLYRKRLAIGSNSTGGK
jgi:hypothetical protein